jgi:transcription elongation factor Elf1
MGTKVGTYYYCPLCGGLAIAVKALFLPGIYRVICVNCGLDTYLDFENLMKWRNRNDMAAKDR